jgi:predicted ATPase
MAPATDPETNGAADARSKPPFLRRVRIRGYKSIAFCDLTFEPLTIFVGRNASGKSNLLEALGFLTDLVEMRATEAVDQRGGWRFVHCRTGTSPHIEMEIEATLAGYQPTLDATYSFVLAEEQRGLIHVLRESLLLTERHGSRRCGYQFSGGRVEWKGNETDWAVRNVFPNVTQYTRSGYLSQTQLLLGVIILPPVSELSEEFRASHTHNFSPAEMRTPKPIRGGPSLSNDGSNIARALEGIREIEPRAIARIQQYLSNIVPDIKMFQRIAVGNDYETLEFELQQSRGGSRQIFDAASMSDGTLRALAALVAANKIYFPTNASGFVGIEEPETSLHPSAMRALVDALDEATLRTQILLTTHSADMLDNPTIKPENIRVVQMIDGQTVIAPIDAGSVDIVRRNLNSLGGLERDNLLEPDLDDLERQRRLAESHEGSAP